MTVVGPYQATGCGETPSRRRIFTCYPKDSTEETACATQIISNLIRRAYRRTITEKDLQAPLKFFEEARENGGFDASIELAIRAILVSPHFLFRIEQDPVDLPSGTVYRLTDLELASRLSFFLWSSIPDDDLIEVAARGHLTKSEVLVQQVRRMLADPRSEMLASNFAAMVALAQS